MGRTYVTLGRDAAGKPTAEIAWQVGFWMNNSVLELWLRLVALHIEEPPSNRPDLDRDGCPAMRIRNRLLLASKGYVDCVLPGLDEATATEEGLGIVRRAVASVSDELKRLRKPLAPDLLNLLGFDGGRWKKEMPVDVLLDVADAFDALLRFEVEARVHSREWMPGTKPRPKSPQQA